MFLTPRVFVVCHRHFSPSFFFLNKKTYLLFILPVPYPQMPSVTVKDVNQQEFVMALSAFLKK